MNEVSERNFGYLIAYLLPGAIVVAAAAERVEAVRTWLGAGNANATIGGFLYVTLAAVGAGLVASALRWAILDTLHHRTGVRPPRWDFSRLQQNLTAFQGVVENHYRYYQAFGNMLAAFGLGLLLAPSWRTTLVEHPANLVVAVALAIVLFAASRDALRKYYDRSRAVFTTSRILNGKEEHDDQRLAR